MVSLYYIWIVELLGPDENGYPTAEVLCEGRMTIGEANALVSAYYAHLDTDIYDDESLYPSQYNA